MIVLLTIMLLMLYFTYNIFLGGEIMMPLSMIVMGIIGLILAVAPQKIAKQSVLEDPSKLRLVRIIGVFVVICCIFALVLMSGL